MLIILFGRAGVGKTYLGRYIKDHFGYDFWDADQILPASLKQKIKNHLPFSCSDRNSYIKKIIEKTRRLKLTSRNLVVSQALYKNQNRHQIQSAFPKALLIEVNAQPELIISRLKLRNNSVTIEYADQIARSYEFPDRPYPVIENNGDNDRLHLAITELLAQPLEN